VARVILIGSGKMISLQTLLKRFRRYRLHTNVQARHFALPVFGPLVDRRIEQPKFCSAESAFASMGA
jgi:hypothetical protein